MTTHQNNNLNEILYEVWEEYFSDVPRKNLIIVKYGKFSKQRLGSIKWCQNLKGVKGIYKHFEKEHLVQDDKRITLIILTRYFSLPGVPPYVIKTTLAHELVHYTHGFNSPLPKLFKNPHQGGIIKREIIKRGLAKEYKLSEEWLKKNWVKFIKNTTIR